MSLLAELRSVVAFVDRDNLARITRGQRLDNYRATKAYLETLISVEIVEERRRQEIVQIIAKGQRDHADNELTARLAIDRVASWLGQPSVDVAEADSQVTA